MISQVPTTNGSRDMTFYFILGYVSRGNNRNTVCASSIIHKFQKFGIFPTFYDILQLFSMCPKNFGKKVSHSKNPTIMHNTGCYII